MEAHEARACEQVCQMLQQLVMTACQFMVIGNKFFGRQLWFSCSCAVFAMQACCRTCTHDSVKPPQVSCNVNMLATFAPDGMTCAHSADRLKRIQELKSAKATLCYIALSTACRPYPCTNKPSTFCSETKCHRRNTCNRCLLLPTGSEGAVAAAIP